MALLSFFHNLNEFVMAQWLSMGSMSQVFTVQGQARPNTISRLVKEIGENMELLEV